MNEVVGLKDGIKPWKIFRHDQNEISKNRMGSTAGLFNFLQKQNFGPKGKH